MTPAPIPGEKPPALTPSGCLIDRSHGRRTQNPRTTRPDDRPGTPPPFRRARPRHRHSAHLAGSAIRRRAAGRERLLLRRRTAAPHLARGLREDRGRDEKGNEGEPRLRAHRRHPRRSSGHGRTGDLGALGARPDAEQVQARHHPGHSRRRRRSRSTATAISPISAPGRTSCAPATSAPSSSPT